jgi:CheY-like chemotaxis protein
MAAALQIATRSWPVALRTIVSHAAIHPTRSAGIGEADVECGGHAAAVADGEEALTEIRSDGSSICRHRLTPVGAASLLARAAPGRRTPDRYANPALWICVKPHTPQRVIIRNNLLSLHVLLDRSMDRRQGYRALIVEDDEGILRLVKTVLEREQFVVEGVRDGRSALELLKTVAYDLLILDLMLPDIGGEDVLDYLEETQPKYLRRVIITTASPRKMRKDFLERICRILAKPFDIHQLLLIARECASGEDCEPTVTEVAG